MIPISNIAQNQMLGNKHTNPQGRLEVPPATALLRKIQPEHDNWLPPRNPPNSPWLMRGVPSALLLHTRQVRSNRHHNVAI